MSARARTVLLLSLLIVAWAAVVTLVAEALRKPSPENPTCRQLKEDGVLRRRTTIKLSREVDRPPHVTPRELSVVARSELVRACSNARRRNDRGGEGRRRPLGADLRGTVERRLRELEARRR
jgi:hypothetical protein